MNRVLETDFENRFIRVQTGRTNLSVTGAVEEEGFFYAPDPSSQLACAIAGNIAMNSGGAHCLKYGVTTNNLLGVTMVLMDGTVVEIGGAHLDAPGYDLLGVVCGSEGQLGVVTEATLRILREAGRGAAGADGVRLERGGGGLRRRHHPRRGAAGGDRVHGPALHPRLRGVRPCRLSGRGGAADRRGRGGGGGDRRAARARITEMARRHHPEVLRESGSAEESALIWKGRKAAFGAMGQIADYICLDGTIPVGELPFVLRRIGELTAGYGLAVANVFHAGDGNMHPLILYDANKPGELEKAEALGRTSCGSASRSAGA